MIRPGRLWGLLSRDIRRGLDASRHFYHTLPRITAWRWPFWNEATRRTPVHVLTGAQDWLLAAWMLASWHHFSADAWPVVVHDDGTLPEEGRKGLGEMFPTLRIIGRSEADSVMAAALKAYPHCAEYRAMHPLALKIFDIAHFTTANHFLLFDSDLLFFARPAEIMDWIAAPGAGCWFNQEVVEKALISDKEAREELGIDLWPRVNTGLCLIHKEAIDLELCEHALARTAIMRGKLSQVEQTLFAICATRNGAGGILPETYEVSLGKRAAPDAISRHYIAEVRDRFFDEGLDRLQYTLLDPDY